MIACPGGQPEHAYTDGAGGLAVRLARITLPEAPCQHRKQNFRASHRKNMEKKTDEKMNPKQLEQVSGGCIFFHTWSPDGMVINLDDGEYIEWICKDCGERSYTKNGEDITKEEFEAAKKWFADLPTSKEHYVIDLRKKE